MNASNGHAEIIDKNIIHKMPSPDLLVALVITGDQPQRYEVFQLDVHDFMGEVTCWQDPSNPPENLDPLHKVHEVLEAVQVEQVKNLLHSKPWQHLTSEQNVAHSVPLHLIFKETQGFQRVSWKAGEIPALDQLADQIQRLFQNVDPTGDVLQVLDRSEGIRFKVDDVEPAQTPFPQSRLIHRLRRTLEAEVMATSFDAAKTGVESHSHGLVAAIHSAFSRHHPLVLCPDSLWITVAQGVSTHIATHAEVLRSQFVDHAGKKTLNITTDENFDPYRSIEEWSQRLTKWSDMVETEVKNNFASLFLCDFSTTTPTARLVSQVVMMDAFKSYFEYTETCICGIPEITLKGSVQDWEHFREKVRALDAIGLSMWTRHLLPLCDQFICTAKGHPSKHFWQSIYKPIDAYGGELITGWIKLFFLYLGSEPDAQKINELLEKPFQGFASKDSVYSRNLSDGLSKVAITVIQVHFDGTSTLHPFQLVAGVVGATQDPETLRIEPLLGWGVAKTSYKAIKTTHQNPKNSPLKKGDLLQVGLKRKTADAIMEIQKREGRIGRYHLWGFDLGDCKDLGSHVVVGRNPQESLLIEKKTGHVYVGNPEGQHPIKANTSIERFNDFVLRFNRFFDGDMPLITIEQVGVLNLFEDIEAILMRDEPSALVHPEDYWPQRLKAQGWPLRKSNP